VYDCLEEPGPDGDLIVCQITERVRGRSLRSLLGERGTLDTAETLSMMASIARALHGAHEAGIVHCALTPENLIVDGDGAVTIVDFGFQSPDGEQRPGPYSAPESRRGTVTGDVYSLGAIAVECLTGSPPDPDASSPAGDTVVPSAILRALARFPKRRFSTAAGFAEACGEPEPDDSPEPQSQTPQAAAAPHPPDGPPAEPETVEQAAAEQDTAADDTESHAPPKADEAAAAAGTAAGGSEAAPPTVSGEPDQSSGTGEQAAESAPESGRAPQADADASATTGEPDLASGGGTEGDETAVSRPPAGGDSASLEAGDAEAPDDVPPPEKQRRSRAAIIAVLIVLLLAAAVVMHLVRPSEPTGNSAKPDPTTDTSSSASPSTSSAPSTDADRSPNSADPAPTTAESSDSESPTPGDGELVVPGVVGKQPEFAATQLYGAGFDVDIDRTGDGRYECPVESQNPDAGSIEPEGSTVTITVRRAHSTEQCPTGTLN
ncbi:MAG: protein kinase domain-containing protein, partial [Stackebrandtia sp.]